MQFHFLITASHTISIFLRKEPLHYILFILSLNLLFRLFLLLVTTWVYSAMLALVDRYPLSLFRSPSSLISFSLTYSCQNIGEDIRKLDGGVQVVSGTPGRVFGMQCGASERVGVRECDVVSECLCARGTMWVPIRGNARKQYTCCAWLCD